jgi:hypothetical protein
MNEIDKLDIILRHINSVQENCTLLGKRLIDRGEFDLGVILIANGQIHDNSKFCGVEWDHLFPGDPQLGIAVSQHNRTNRHHPEHWGGIDKMPRVFLAECVCDWKTRSSEFGSSLHAWIDGDAAKRFIYTKNDEVYERIMYFANLLCDKPFAQKS